VWPLVFWAERELGERGGWLSGLAYFLLHPMLRVVPPPEPLTEERQNRIEVTLVRLRKRDPLEIYVERTVSRDNAFKLGEYADAVVHQAIAVEVLLRAVAGMMLWERYTLDTARARRTLLKQPGWLMSEFFARELGGDWDLQGSGPASRWRADVARLRNRVIHRGDRPSPEEAERAFGAAYELDRYVTNRLAANLHTYPRTAGLLLGRPGLERYGVYERIRSLVEDVSEPDWVAAHAAWLDAIGDPG
jgi:hypothetical protein